MSKKDKGLSGKQKAALLLISLGPEVSASVYKHLSEEEIERLTLEISSVKKVESAVKENIIESYADAISRYNQLPRWKRWFKKIKVQLPQEEE